MLHFLQAQGKATALQEPHGHIWEKRVLLSALSEKLLQCIKLLQDVQLLPRGITKALFRNVSIGGHLQCCQSQTRWPTINYYIGYCLQMSESLLRKLILTFCKLNINRKQQTISRLFVRVQWHNYWHFPWNLCTHRYTYCVYIPTIYGLSVPSADAQSLIWLAQLLQSLILLGIWTHCYYYYLSTIIGL